MNTLLIVTNASQSEAAAKLKSTGDWCPITPHTELIVFSHVQGLLKYTEVHTSGLHVGPVIFMFFDGLDYIEETISSFIELSQPPIDTPRDKPLQYSMYLSCNSSRRSSTASTASNSSNSSNISNCSNTSSASVLSTKYSSMFELKDLKLYIDLSVVENNNGETNFCSIATHAGLLLNKLAILNGSRSLYIDDIKSTGSRDQPTRCLLRSYPGLNVELSSGIH